MIYYNYELVCGSQRIDSGRFQLNRAQDAGAPEALRLLHLLPESAGPPELDAPAGTSGLRQKLSFKLKEEKSWNWEKQENGRLVQMFFVDLENEQEF